MLVAVIAGVASRSSSSAATRIRLHLQDDGRAGRLARRDARGHPEQVTERLERKLQETPLHRLPAQLHQPRRHDDLRRTSGSRLRPRVPDIWYQVRKNIGDIRRTLPAGRGRSGLQRRVRRHLRHHLRLHRRRLHASRTARLCRGRPLAAAAGAGRLEDRDPRRAGRADLRRVLDREARRPRPRLLRDRCAPAGAERRAPVGRDPDRRRKALAAGLRRLRRRARHPRRQLPGRRPHDPPRRHRRGAARLRRSAAADVPRQRQAGDRPRRSPCATAATSWRSARTSSRRWRDITADLPLGIEPILVADQP